MYKHINIKSKMTNVLSDINSSLECRLTITSGCVTVQLNFMCTTEKKNEVDDFWETHEEWILIRCRNAQNSFSWNWSLTSHTFLELGKSFAFLTFFFGDPTWHQINTSRFMSCSKFLMAFYGIKNKNKKKKFKGKKFNTIA